MELAKSLLCVQLLANGAYPETYESSPQLPYFQLKAEKVNLSLYIPCKHTEAAEVLYHNFKVHLNITSLPTPSSFKWSSPFTNIVYAFVASLKHATYTAHHFRRDSSL